MTVIMLNITILDLGRARNNLVKNIQSSIIVPIYHFAASVGGLIWPEMLYQSVPDAKNEVVTPICPTQGRIYDKINQVAMKAYFSLIVHNCIIPRCGSQANILISQCVISLSKMCTAMQPTTLLAINYHTSNLFGNTLRAIQWNHIGYWRL